MVSDADPRPNTLAARWRFRVYGKRLSAHARAADPYPRRRRHHMAQSRRDFLKTAAAGAGTLSGSIGFPMVSRAQAKTVVVWWNRGYYKEEDESMIKIA